MDTYVNLEAIVWIGIIFFILTLDSLTESEYNNLSLVELAAMSNTSSPPY